MSIWQKIKLGCAFLFGSFEAMSDYILQPLNNYLAKTNVADKVAKTRAYIGDVLGYLSKFAPYCPQKWASAYASIQDEVQHLYDSLADGQISGAELQAAVEGVRIAIDKWNKD